MAKRAMTDEQRAARAAYMRRWRAANVAKLREYRRGYILRAAERLRSEAGGGDDHAGD